MSEPSKIPIPVACQSKNDNDIPKVAEVVKKLETNEKEYEDGKRSTGKREPTMKEIQKDMKDMMSTMTTSIAMLVNSINVLDRKFDDKFDKMTQQINPEKIDAMIKKIDNIEKETKDNNSKIQENSEALELVMTRIARIERENATEVRQSDPTLQPTTNFDQSNPSF